MGCRSGGDLLVEADVLFNGSDADFKLEAFVDFVLLELGQLGVEAFDVVLVAISLRRSVMSSLVAKRWTTKPSISPSSLSVVFLVMLLR
jgi:hypothetical protein